MGEGPLGRLAASPAFAYARSILALLVVWHAAALALGQFDLPPRAYGMSGS